MLEVDQLYKAYRAGNVLQQVFAGVDLTLAQGENVALVGASGSGKTTLLNLLSGIDTPDAGRVRIDGRDLHALGEPALTLFRRHHIGFVFQFFNLIPTLTVGENVALPIELAGTDGATRQARVAELLAQVGLDAMADRYPDTLSGGEQQRVAVARGLAHRPRLLLADEPTGNLDEATGDRIITLLSTLAHEQGTALLIVTHSQRVAAAADRVLRLDSGRLVAA